MCATGARGDIRVWHMPTLRELLRVTVPGLDCCSLFFAQVLGAGGLHVLLWGGGLWRQRWIMEQHKESDMLPAAS